MTISDHGTEVGLWPFVPPLFIIKISPTYHAKIRVPTRNLFKITGPSLGISKEFTTQSPRIFRLKVENLGHSHIIWKPISFSRRQVHFGSCERPILLRCLFSPQCPVIALLTAQINYNLKRISISSNNNFSKVMSTKGVLDIIFSSLSPFVTRSTIRSQAFKNVLFTHIKYKLHTNY